MKPPSHDPLIVSFGPAGRTGDYIQLRMPQWSAIAVSGALRAEGITIKPVPQASAGIPDLVALAVSIGTGLGGVAAVLSAYLRRHQDKAFIMERDGTRYELRGMSPDDMHALIGRMLENAAEEQRRTEHLYRGIPGADDDLDDQ